MDKRGSKDENRTRTPPRAQALRLELRKNLARRKEQARARKPRIDPSCHDEPQSEK
jgi:hypothetical protein